MTQEKTVDEGWKETAKQEKEKVVEAPKEKEVEAPKEKEVEASKEKNAVETPEFDFRAYITSLAMQALIFMGVMPNPMDENKTETNLDQARLLIDTLTILREKTQGNLNKEEEELLNTMLYELQVKFVEVSSSASGT